MRKFKSMFCMFLVLVLFAAPISLASAESIDTETVVTFDSPLQATSIRETTQLSPQEYSTAALISDSTITTSSAVQVICELFISSMYANRRDSQYDMSVFTVDHSLSNDTLAYINSVNEYQREVNRLCNFNIVSDELYFGNFSASIEGNTCTAQIETMYYYDITGTFDETCNLNRVYYFELIETGNGWKISSVTSSDPQEQVESFEYASFDGKAAALNVYNESLNSNSTVYTEEVTIPQAIFPLGNTTYDHDAAIAYAELYYNETTRPNSMFSVNYNTEGKPVNCQNFVSQCVWAGLLEGCNASGTSTTARPAVSTSLAGSSAANVWCHNQYTNYYGNDFDFNWAWDNVCGFMMLIDTNDYTQEGPQGALVSGLSYAAPGYAIAVNYNGTGTISNKLYDHAMFVTDATGTIGSRGMANLFIAANSSPTESAYMPLANYSSRSPYASYYATIRIYCGSYCVSGAVVPTPGVE